MKKVSYSEKTIVITGASSGIGAETARQFAAHGACVILVSRSIASLTTLKNQIVSSGGFAHIYPVDVSDPAAVKDFAEDVLKKFKKIDILVISAGQYIRSPMTELTLQDLKKSMSTNFYGGVNCVLSFLPSMLANPPAGIVIVSTMDVRTPLPLDAPYVAAKSALTGFADVLRQELHNSGIRVSIVFPGRVDTPMLQSLNVPKVSAKIPPSAVASAILRAASTGKAHTMLPFQVHILYWLSLISPNLADWVSKKFHLQGWESLPP